MTIRTERVVIDTNVWIFGLRRTPTYIACSQLLDRLGELTVVLPRQILRELQTNLNDEELQDFFQVVNLHPTRIQLDWRTVPIEFIRKYQFLGGKRGDAVVAAHLEHLGIPVLVSENQEFLSGISDLPFRIVRPSGALAELVEAPQP